MKRGPIRIPPRYTNVASAPTYDRTLNDPLKVTFVEISGLCWEHNYELTPPITMADLCIIRGIEERRMWSHLTALRDRKLIWWTTEAGGYMIIHLTRPDEAPSPSVAASPPPANLAALAEFGVNVDEPFARQVAASPDVTPELIRAWAAHLSQRRNVDNLPGMLLYVLDHDEGPPAAGKDPRGGRRVKGQRAGQAPAEQLSLGAAGDDPDRDGRAGQPDDPDTEALKRALLLLGVASDEAIAEIAGHPDREKVWAWAEWVQHNCEKLTNPGGYLRKAVRGENWPPEDPRTSSVKWRQLRPDPDSDADAIDESEESDVEAEEDPPSEVWTPPSDLDVRGKSGSSLWQQVLGELQLQMTRATFDTWLRGSRLIAFEANDDGEPDRFTVYVRHLYAVDWLSNRLNPKVVDALARLHGKPVEVKYGNGKGEGAQ